MAPSLKLNNSYLVLGITTDIGKSFLVENLCWVFLKKHIPVNAIKPIASGFSDDDLKSDSARILKALNKEISLKNINKITPWRFKEAISPHFAAKLNNSEIDFLELVNFCKKNISESKTIGQTLFIESAGGLMTPINDHKTFLDLAFELEIPVLLLGANYLGAISQTLCALEALKNRQIFVEKIIINDDLYKPHPNSTDKLIETIENFSKIKTVTLKNFINDWHYN